MYPTSAKMRTRGGAFFIACTFNATTAYRSTQNPAPLCATNPALILADGCRRMSAGDAGLWVKGVAMATSKLQSKTKERLLVILNKYRVIENYRPNWLKNPVTGRNLEIDLYLPEVKIGIEVQGKQHFEYIPIFHQSEDGFAAQKQRDEIKKSLCSKHGVILFEVIEKDDIDRFIDEVSEHRREMGFELYKRYGAYKAVGYLAARLHKTKCTNPHNREGISGLANRILHIADKYNIPIESIRPDFEASNLEVANFDKPIVRYDHHYNWRKGKFNKQGALLRVEDGIATVAVMVPGKVSRHIRFDLSSDGDDIEETTNLWRLDLATVPENYTNQDDSEID